METKSTHNTYSIICVQMKVLKIHYQKKYLHLPKHKTRFLAVILNSAYRWAVALSYYLKPLLFINKHSNPKDFWISTICFDRYRRWWCRMMMMKVACPLDMVSKKRLPIKNKVLKSKKLLDWSVYLWIIVDWNNS